MVDRMDAVRLADASMFVLLYLNMYVKGFPYDW